MRLMQTRWAEQYGVPCVISDAHTADDIIRNCREVGAIYREDGPDDECFVVDVGRGVGPELYTEAALRRPASGTIMSKITPGKWHASPYSSVVGIAIMAQPDPTENEFMVCAVRGRTREECEANAAAILRSAARQESKPMSYDTCKNASPYELGVHCRQRSHGRDANNMPDMVAKAEFDRGWCDENARQGLPENAPEALRRPAPTASLLP